MDEGWVPGDRKLALRVWIGRARSTVMFVVCCSGLGVIVVQILDTFMLGDFPKIREAVVLFCIVLPLLAGCVWLRLRLWHRPISLVAIRPRWGAVRLIAAPDRYSPGGEWYTYNVRFILFRACDVMEFCIPCEYQGQKLQARMEVCNGYIRMKGFRYLTSREQEAWDSNSLGYSLLDPRTVYDRGTDALIVQQS